MDIQANDDHVHPGLCQACKHWRRWTSIGTKIEPIRRELTYGLIISNSHCIVCKWVLHTVNTVVSISEFESTCRSEIRVDVSGPLLVTRDTYTPDEYQRRRIQELLPTTVLIYMMVHISTESKTSPSKSDKSTLLKLPIVSTPRLQAHYTHDGTLSNVDDFQVPHFDLKVLRTWLQLCQDHGPACIGSFGSRKNIPVGFRLIDVVSQNVIRPSKVVSFVALSYMWSIGGTSSASIKLEKANVSFLETPGSLTQDMLPNVIWYSMRLCRELGERFLWIDRLCIIQDDINSKATQIEAMGHIYSSASFTIAAALNSRTVDGLPGCPEQARHPHSSLLRPPLRQREPTGISDLINKSMWNGRGWTFQERLLSKRRLYISDYQVVFECSVAVAEEELTWDLSVPERPGGPINSKRRRLANFLQGKMGKQPEKSPPLPGQLPYSQIRRFSSASTWDMLELPGYFQGVQDYCSRQLSFGTDILDAFSGVGNIIAAGLRTTMLFCLPERHLLECLLWTCNGPFARKDYLNNILSWSWASCARPVHYINSAFVDLEDGDICSIVEFYYQDPLKGLRKLATSDRWMDHIVPLRDVAKQRELPQVTPGSKSPKEERSSEIWPKCAHNPWHAIELSGFDQDSKSLANMFPGALVFNTTAASLHIPDSDSLSMEGLGRSRIKADAMLCNAQGIPVVGLIEMGAEWMISQQSLPDADKRFYDCIVLCGAMLPSRSSEWSPDVHKPRRWLSLVVMVVERLPCEPSIARRVCLGWVDPLDWNTCNPRWETVVLC